MPEPNWKPHRGAYLLERKTAQKQHKAREQKTMADAKRRDGNKCRVPRCRYTDMPVDCAHVVHRGAGGDPRESRTVSPLLWAACRIHHSMYDRGDLRVEPLTDKGMDGPAAYYEQHAETGKWECIGVERSIGISVERAL